MRHLKCSIKVCNILLLVSVIFNMALLIIVYIEESRGLVFSAALERRDKIVLTDNKCPDYYARSAWENTIKKMHTEFDVAFLGNSITCGSDFQLYFPDKKIINLGYGGDNIRGMIRRVSMLQASHPQKIFIMAGTNDLVHINLDEYRDRYITLLSLIQDSIPTAKLYLESVLPGNSELGNKLPNIKIQQANEIVKQLAMQYNCVYVNLYEQYVDENNQLPKEFTRDGVHLFPQYYDRWAEVIRPLIYD